MPFLCKSSLCHVCLRPMDGKAAVSGDAARAGLEEAHAGTHPNSELLRQFEELSKQCFEAGNEGDPSQKFKGSAYMKAARVSAQRWRNCSAGRWR